MSAVLLRRWTRQEYDHMVEAGVFSPHDHVELLDGEILAMTPQSSAHATAIGLVEAALRPLFSADHHLRTQRPFALDDKSEPEPDIAVVPGGLRQYRNAHPTTAVLLVEVSDTTLLYDRTHKAAAYARAGIPEYWIVNLSDGVLEVYRDPLPAPETPLGWAYQTTRVVRASETVAPLTAPKAQILIRDLLP